MREVYLPSSPTAEIFSEQFSRYDTELYKEMIRNEGVRWVARDEMNYWVRVGKATRKGTHPLPRELMIKMILKHFS